MSEHIAYESLVSRYLDTAALGERSLWLRADIAVEARNLHRVTASEWAAQVGCSASWVRQMWRAVDAFSEESRIAALPFTLHAIAAHADSPQTWAERAHDEQWSAADLRRALKGSQTLTDEEHLQAGERILQRLRKWGEGVPASVRQAVAEKVLEWAVGA